MFEKVLKMPRVLNMLGLDTVKNMSKYVRAMPKYV